MMKHPKKYKGPSYICFFCKSEIKASSKTEVFYRSDWIDGCAKCFALSIAEDTSKVFQSTDY